MITETVTIAVVLAGLGIETVILVGNAMGWRLPRRSKRSS